MRCDASWWPTCRTTSRPRSPRLQGYVDTLLLKDDALTRRGAARLSRDRLAQLRAAGQAGGRPDRAGQARCPRGHAAARAVLRRRAAAGRRAEVPAASRAEAGPARPDFPERLPYVSGDIGLIERVLENLIGNALTHTPAHGEVRLGVTVDGDEASIDVADTGRGIAQRGPDPRVRALLPREQCRTGTRADTPGSVWPSRRAFWTCTAAV